MAQKKERKDKKEVAFVVIFIFLSILLFLSFISDCFPNIPYTAIFKIVVALIYSFIIFPRLFKYLLSLKENKYYHYLHFFHVFFPIALVGHISQANQTLCLVIITQFISIVNIIRICHYCKNKGEDNIKNLRYSNLFLTYIFTFLLTMYDLCHYFIGGDTKRPILTFLFILPLLGLQVAYSKLEAEKKTKEG